MTYFFKDTKYINPVLIKDNWDDILRFVASIKLKITTASQLFKRLNSYSRTHPLYKAIKELGRIFKTIFILNYIDDLPFRQAIEKQLNLGELSNKFSRAVMVGGNQEFNVGLKEDQQLIEGCKRLIQNSIILWNSLYLSTKLCNAETPDDKDNMIKIIQNGSIMTWSHINFTGEYDFNEEQLQNSISFDMNKICNLKV
jgi:TnpA family transposase